MRLSSQSGLTLVELAIVLTIIGLLVGGVLAGHDLIRSAELNSLNADAKRYAAAANIFHEKYHALPGDMTNATSYWGVLASTGSDTTCQNTKATGTATCNGNGDGHVMTSVVATDEMWRFWQHLANAGLIVGQYAGTMNGFTPALQLGSNLPASKLNGIGWETVYYGYQGGTVSVFAGNYGHVLIPINAASSNSVTLSPKDAYQVDSKFDDGLPATGNIMAYKGTSTLKCTSRYGAAVAAADQAATYNMSDSVPECVVYFPNAF